VHKTLDTSLMDPKDGVTAPWQILDVHLFWRFLSTLMEFGHETSSIASSAKLSFHAYKQHPYWTLCAAWASFLVRATTELRDGLEHDLGLHLDDSNRISFGPPSRFENPYWSLWSLYHSPSMVVCTEVMSSHATNKISSVTGISSIAFPQLQIIWSRHYTRVPLFPLHASWLPKL